MERPYSLFELTNLVRCGLREYFPETYWVQAEISECHLSGGHCYLELVEKDRLTDQLKAKCRAIIWSNVWLPLSMMFEQQTGSKIGVGIKILASVRVEFHELYGFSLTVSDIDPSFTLGEWAMRRLAVVRRLEEEGLKDLNKELEWPELPQRLAVISSSSAAGYGDFSNQLRHSGYIFYTKLFAAQVQGVQAETSIIAALDRIIRHLDSFDAVVVIRGGGASTDMSCFDSYEVASALSQFPLPVLTGIGHDRDRSVADMVAKVSVKTPTAAAEYLIDCVRAQEVRIQAAMDQLRYQMSDCQHRESLHLHKTGTRIRNAASKAVYDSMNKTGQLIQNLRWCVEKRIRNESSHLDLAAKELTAYDVEKQLKRGFSMTLCQGHILRSLSGLTVGDKVETLLADGRFQSEVIDKEMNNK